MDEPVGTPALSPEQLAQINRLATVARFVSSLAHELNNSLQVMGGLVELLAERDDLPLDALDRVERIGNEADRASAKIRQVVSYVRQPVAPEARVDIAELVDRALGLRSYELGRSGIDVLWNRPAETHAARGRARELEQVILNLLANAQEALGGAAARQIRITLANADATLRLAIADTGPGVPPDLRGSVFEPFFTRRAGEGALGLGLTVAAQIARAHHGRLTLEDDGPGARFVLTLPREDAPDHSVRPDPDP
jgi:two-component system C4-dicarboxylate transport sensor histidine kinase DctB